MRSAKLHHCVKTRTPFCPERYKILDDTVHYSRDACDESSLRKGGVFKRAIPARMLYCHQPEFRLNYYLLARDRMNLTQTCVTSLVFTLLTTSASLAGSERDKQSLNIEQYVFEVSLPAGFQVELLTANMESPRVIHRSGDRLFIGSRSGKIYMLDPPYTNANVLVTLDDYPHSLVVKDGSLYVARTSGIYRAAFDNSLTNLSPSDFSKITSLPGGRGHNSRTLKEGPDKALYVSLGITGNCSDEFLDTRRPFKDQRGGVFRIDSLDSEPTLTPYASGLRNPIGMDWHPQTGVLYATNNGPDHLGYDMPGEYFARLDENSNHGMPWYQHNGEKLVRDTCIDSDPPFDASELASPVARFPARSAPMDMVFLDQKTGDGSMANDALVALHGSWATDDGGGSGDPASRREPKLVHIDFENGKAGEVTDFMRGFQLENGARWARPMGIAVAPDGSILFTSDGGIQGLYRVVFNGP